MLLDFGGENRVLMMCRKIIYGRKPLEVSKVKGKRGRWWMAVCSAQLEYEVLYRSPQIVSCYPSGSSMVFKDLYTWADPTTRCQDWITGQNAWRQRII